MCTRTLFPIPSHPIHRRSVVSSPFRDSHTYHQNLIRFYESTVCIMYSVIVSLLLFLFLLVLLRRYLVSLYYFTSLFLSPRLCARIAIVFRICLLYIP
ncbi:hypothetical protein R3P38DRAFT_2906658 [Favolaschia claudopus]|uniref:Uncharacterized protein n=1 Tax=Favolaschia claudopus TaxID=2862362 RepID=A0AAW0CIK8_9AGAR